MLSHHHTALGVVISTQIIQRQPPVAAALLPGERGGGLIPPATRRDVQPHHHHCSTNSTAAANTIEFSWCVATAAFHGGPCWLAHAFCQCQMTPKMSKAAHVHNCSLEIGYNKPVLHKTSTYQHQTPVLILCNFTNVSQRITVTFRTTWRRAFCCVADISAWECLILYVITC